MFPALVIGNVWATRKDSRIEGIKLLVVRPLDYLNEGAENQPVIAADWIGAGVGERVIVATGSAARCASGNNSIPIDASVIGIIDGEDIVE